MKPIYVILWIVVASGVKEGSDAFLRNHKVSDAVVAAIGAAAVAILAGMAPSPAQASAIASLRAEILAALQQLQAQGMVPASATNTGQVSPSSVAAPIPPPAALIGGLSSGSQSSVALPVTQNV